MRRACRRACPRTGRLRNHETRKLLDTRFEIAVTSADWCRVRSLPRNRATRGFAAAFAVIALAGQLSSFAHLVLVRHVTCAEHGDLIELGRDRAIAATAVRRHAQVTFADASAEES